LTSEIDVFSVDFDKEKISDVELAVFGSGLLDLYPLVGGGEITNDYCDHFSGYYVCDRVDLHELVGKRLGKDYAGKVYVRKVHFNCGKWVCPSCYRRIALREARKVEVRLEANSKLLKETSESSEIYHVVVSLSPKDYGISDEKVLRAKAKKALEELGIFDGGMMFHGSRHRRYEQIKGGVFRQIGTDWSPHYHFLGFIKDGYKCRDCKRKSNCLAGCGGFDDRRWQYYKETGIYVKVLPKRKSVFWTAAYQLNHVSIKAVKVGVKTRSHIVTYIGSCSCRKLHIKVEKQKLICPICQYELKRSIYNGKKYFATDRNSSDYVCDSLEDLEEDGVVVWSDAPKRSFVRSVGDEPRYGSMEWLRSIKNRGGSSG
jgi:hypothetical protein